MKISISGNRIIGYTDDLRLFLLNIDGKIIADRSINREAEGSKYHIRCVDLNGTGNQTLFTSSTRAFLMDEGLNILTTWIMPPPDGYQIGKREKKESNPIDPEVSQALSILGLQGAPTHDEIKDQFRHLALKYHPDKNPNDPNANEKTKLIVWAYRKLADEDLQSALSGLDDIEYYYKTISESTIEIKDFGISLKVTMSIGGNGDWIYASCISENADCIYLGCYSGKVYCVNNNGMVLKTYVTDDAIRKIEFYQGLLYIQTSYGLYIISENKVLNHIDIGDGELSSYTPWGFIIKKGLVISLFDHPGNLIGRVQFFKELCEIDSLKDGLFAYTKKDRFKIAFQKN